MKSKKMQKKLTLNKNTIYDLSKFQYDKLRGGVTHTVFPCVVSEDVACVSLKFTNCNTCVTCENTQCSGACC